MWMKPCFSDEILRERIQLFSLAGGTIEHTLWCELILFLINLLADFSAYHFTVQWTNVLHVDVGGGGESTFSIFHFVKTN